MRYIIAVLRLLGIVFGVEILFILMLASGPSLLAEGKLDESAALPEPLLSIVHQNAGPTPVPAPELPPALLDTPQPIPQTAGSQEGNIDGWSCSEDNVANQCLCPPGPYITMPIFEAGQTDHACSDFGAEFYVGQSTSSHAKH